MFTISLISIIDITTATPYGDLKQETYRKHPEAQPATYTTVSFHNFKSRNFKLSVSNPESKYVVYVSVLSQISDFQGLGRKQIFQIMKTDRIL